MRNLICYLLAAFLLLSVNLRSQSILASGDIAFVAYISTGSPDTFAFVVLKPAGLEPGTTISFTDNGWISAAQGGPAYRTNEGVLTWRASRLIHYGELVQVWVGTSSGIGSNKGTCQNNTSTISLSTGGDQLFAFQGGVWPNPERMIAGMHYNRTASSTDTNWEPESITQSSNASSFPNGAMGASGSKLLPNSCGVWVRDVSQGASIKAKSAYWKGVADASLLSDDPEVLRANINRNDNWSGYYSGTGAPPWKMPAELARREVQISANLENPRCFGASNGSVHLSVTGGSAPYSYNWLYNGSTNSALNNVPAGNYSCIVKDALNNSKTISVTLQEPSQLELDLPLVQGTCPGLALGSLKVIGSGGTGNLNYVWSDGSTDSLISYKNAGDYRVKVSDENGCSIEQVFTIPEFEVPEINLPEIAPQCPYSSVILTGAKPAGGEYFGEFVTEDHFEPGEAGSYTILYKFITNDVCIVVDSIKVEVVDANSATLADFFPVCLNTPDFALYGAKPNGGHYKGKGVINDRFYPGIAGPGTHEIIYTVGGSNSQCPSVAVAHIVVNSVPVISFPDPQDVCLNSGITIIQAQPAAGVLTGPGVSGRNFDPGISGKGFHELTFTYTRPQTGCSASATQFIQVNDAPDIVVDSKISFCQNQGKVALTMAAPVGGSYSGQFCSSNELDVSQAGVGKHSLNYSLNLSNGCSAQKEFVVEVYPSPELKMGESLKICSNVLTVTLSGDIPLGGIYSGEGVNSGSFEPEDLDPGTHVIYYTFSNEFGCSSTEQREIQLLAPTDLKLTGKTAFCENDSAFILQSVAPLGGVYSGSGVSGAELNPSDLGAGTYDLSYFFANGNGCISKKEFQIVVLPVAKPTINADRVNFCSGETVSLTVAGSFSNHWFRDGLEIDAAGGNKLNITFGGQYSVLTIDSNGCKVSSDDLLLIMHELPKPEIEMKGGNTFCIEKPIALRAGEYKRFTWYKNDSLISQLQEILVQNAGKYKVLVGDSNGCEGISGDIIISENNVAPIIASGTRLCKGDSVVLKTIAAQSFQWLRNGESISGSKPEFVVNKPGSYQVVVLGSDGCEKRSETINISEADLPTPEIHVAGPERFCEGRRNKLIASSGFESYQWFKDEILIPAANYSAHINESSGRFKVLVTDSNGCKGFSEIKNIIVDALPDVDLHSPSFVRTCSGDSPVLSVTDQAAVTFQWFKNQEEISGGTSNRLEINSSGLYGLKASSEAGCEAFSRWVLFSFADPLATPEITEPQPGLLRSLSEGDLSWFRNGISTGVTGQELWVTSSGYYQVRLAENGCESWSEPFNVISLGIDETDAKLLLWPNPASDHIELTSYESGTLFIVASSGEVVKKADLLKGKTRLNISDMAGGIYQLLFVFGGSQYHKRLWIE